MIISAVHSGNVMDYNSGIKRENPPSQIGQLEPKAIYKKIVRGNA